MRLLFLILMVLCSFSYGGSLRLGDEAAGGRIGILRLKKGMLKKEVICILGYPYKARRKTHEGKVYEVWYYLTRRPSLGQARLLPNNFTPVILQDNIVIGWGMPFYNHLFDFEGEREKRLEEERQKYTDHPEEWPANDHRYVPSPQEKLKQEKSAQKSKKAEEPFVPEEGGIYTVPYTDPSDKQDKKTETVPQNPQK